MSFHGFVTNNEVWPKLRQFLHALDAAGESYNETAFHMDIFNK